MGNTIYQMITSGSTAGMILQVLPITCLVGILYAVARCLWLKKQQRSVALGPEIVKFLFVCYLAALISLVLVPNHLWTYIWAHVFLGYSGSQIGPFFIFEWNIVPMLIRYWMGELTLGSWVKTMLVGNVLLFVPMGFFWPLIFPKGKRYRIGIVAVAVPLAIELVQPIIGRSFDMDDIICNLLGILIGCGIYWIVKSIAPGFVRKCCGRCKRPIP